MNNPSAADFTTGEGSILVEIDAELAPITPEILARPRVRAPWLRPEPDSEAPPAERPVDGSPAKPN
jgi:hypothetical protein